MRPATESLREVRLAVLQTRAEYEIAPYGKPLTRGDCVSGPRPCQFATCKWHLGMEVTSTGGLQKRFPDHDLGFGEESCALDVADRGGATLEEVGRVLNITRERVRQCETIALTKLKASGIDLESVFEPPWHHLDYKSNEG